MPYENRTIMLNLAKRPKYLALKNEVKEAGRIRKSVLQYLAARTTGTTATQGAGVEIHTEINFHESKPIIKILISKGNAFGRSPQRAKPSII